MRNEPFALETLDGISLFAQSWLPEGPARAGITLVHGLGEHSGRYTPLAEAMTSAGFAVFTMDLRGHGRSPGPRGHAPSFDALAGDITRLVDHAQASLGSLPLFIYGHSLGGSLVLYTLLTRKPPVRGAVVTSPGLAPAAPVSGLTQALGHVLSAVWPSFSMANGLDLTGLSRDPRVIEAYRSDPLVHGRISARLGMEVLQKGQWTLAHAAELGVPTLLMQGSADRLVDPRATRAFAERAGSTVTYVEWPGAYHELHNDLEKEAVVSTELKWLDEHISGG